MKNFRFLIFYFRLVEPRIGTAAAFSKSKTKNQKSKMARAARAFSLVEVLIALAIFALGAIVLASS